MQRRLVASLVGLSLLTAACGASGTTVDASADKAAPTPESTAPVTAREAVSADTLSGVAWATTGAGTAVSTFRAVVEVPGVGEVTFGGEGFVDLGNQRGSLDLDVTDLIVANGLTGIAGDFDMIFDGTTSYLRAPLIESIFSSPTPWLSFEVTELPPRGKSSFGDGLRGLTQFAGHDPAMPLDLLGGVREGTVYREGVEVVDGVSMTRYTAAIDVRKALGSTPAAVRDRLMERIGAEDLDVEVLVDADGHLRRFSYVEADGVVDWGFRDFGTPVDLVIPAGDQVSPMYDVVPPF